MLDSNGLMHYVCEVNRNHVVSVNGKNQTVEVKAQTSSNLRAYSWGGVTVYVDFTINSYGKPFTSILIAVEMTRMCMKQDGII
jgi:hypothetical protein